LGKVVQKSVENAKKRWGTGGGRGTRRRKGQKSGHFLDTTGRVWGVQSEVRNKTGGSN